MDSFQYITPSAEEIAVMQNFRDKFQALADEIALTPDCQGKSTALTKLREAAFWLNAGITGNS